MKLTEELKQRIIGYFESISEEEVQEILKGYGLIEEELKKKGVKEVSVDLLKMDDETKLKLFDGFVDANLKNEYEFRFSGFNGDRVVNKRTITLYSPEMPMSMFLKNVK